METSAYFVSNNVPGCTKTVIAVWTLHVCGRPICSALGNSIGSQPKPRTFRYAKNFAHTITVGCWNCISMHWRKRKSIREMQTGQFQILISMATRSTIKYFYSDQGLEAGFLLITVPSQWHYLRLARHLRSRLRVSG